ncbi:MAG: hypothetical protein GC164_14090 [Phycisphaera sp.]|nr:hypothetical protein [Phycisphaera sp.]
MRNVMSMADYRKLFPHQVSYPKRTSQAATELVTRGLKASVATLDYLVNKGEVRMPRGDKRTRHWYPWHIMEAARYLEKHEAFTPEGWRCVMEDVDLAQDIRAFRAACAQAPHLPPDRGYFVRTVTPSGPCYRNGEYDVPGMAARRVYATVSYRPISVEQLAEWGEMLDAAKSQGVAA